MFGVQKVPGSTSSPSPETVSVMEGEQTKMNPRSDAADVEMETRCSYRQVASMAAFSPLLLLDL